MEPLDEADQAGLEDEVDDVVDNAAEALELHDKAAPPDDVKDSTAEAPTVNGIKGVHHPLTTNVGGGGVSEGGTGSITSTVSSHSSTSPQDSHNDSGYSTRIGFSAGPSPSLSSKIRSR